MEMSTLRINADHTTESLIVKREGCGIRDFQKNSSCHKRALGSTCRKSIRRQVTRNNKRQETIMVKESGKPTENMNPKLRFFTIRKKNEMTLAFLHTFIKIESNNLSLRYDLI